MTARGNAARNVTSQQSGFTLVELLVTASISLLIIAGLSGVIQATVESKTTLDQRMDLTRQASFAMQRMVRAVSHSRRLLLPLADKAWSSWPENIREETVPPSPPVGGSTLATAVLAVTLPEYVDLDFNGIPDADDDGDGLIDEDLPNDNHHDFFPGIQLIDDGGDGQIDNGSYSSWDDDESSDSNEDSLDGADNDDDNNVDEDPASDNNGDGCPGICGVDDDGDGQIDEGSNDDDDEDGATFDDPYDPVVFYLDINTLMERMPVPWNEDGISTPDGPVDGRDFVASPIADNVTRLRFERLPASNGVQLVDITLELTSGDGQMVNLNRRVRVGGAL